MKHLIVLIDGTSRNAAVEKKYSNIYNLNLAINSSNRRRVGNRFVRDQQICFYSAGPGSSYSQSFYNKLHKRIDEIYGDSVQNIVQEMYINICSNFEAGDKIYIFGFSRGAVAARILSNMISECGLLAPEFIKYFDKMENIYFERMDGRERSSALSELLRVMHQDNENYRLDSAVHHDEIEIEIVGALDTVSGRSKNRAYGRYYLRNFELAKRAKVGLQFLAIDESRPIFSPHLWESSAPNQYVEQIWVPGVHSDVGGYFESDFISNVVLLTMIERMRNFGIGLEFHDELINSILTSVNSQIPSINNERVSAWKYLGFKKRKINFSDKSKTKNYVEGQPGFYLTLHPIFFRLNGKEIGIRGHQKIYRNKYFENMNPKSGLVTLISPRLSKAFAVKNYYNLNEIAATR